MTYANGKPELSAEDVAGAVAVLAVHDELLKPSIQTHGPQAVTNWVIKMLSLFEFGLPNDPNQRAYRLDAWVEEVGKYPAWALAKVAGWTKLRKTLPTLGDAVQDFELAIGSYKRTRDALAKVVKLGDRK